MAIYAKFNERAQRVLSVAQKEAQAMRHPYVGTEHLLLALVAEARDDVPDLPESMTEEAVRSAIRIFIGQGTGLQAPLELTPRAKKLLESSVREAQRLGHPYVTSAHIWLALLGESEGVAARILTSLGAFISGGRGGAAHGLARRKRRLPKGAFPCAGACQSVRRPLCGCTPGAASA